ncbi:MAG: transposase [Nitrospiraceae bacterium]
MARKPRIDFPGGIYHVIARGNRRAPIFHERADYTAYLERLERYRRRDGVQVHAYVLMPNHVHLLIETGERPLSRTMQTLQFTYSQYYNRRYDKSGHVFQGRYQAILCDRDAYLLELVRYLHLNPARMRAPLSPWTYPWSSHAAYLGQPGPVEISTAAVLEAFHRQMGPARRAYRQFMREGVGLGHEDRFYDTVDQQMLGDTRFIAKVQRRTATTQIRTVQAPHATFGTLLTAVAEVCAVTPKTLVAPGRQRAHVPVRALLVFLAREWGRMSTQELGRRLHRDPSMISRLASAYALHRDETLEARVRQAIGN